MHRVSTTVLKILTAATRAGFNKRESQNRPINNAPCGAAAGKVLMSDGRSVRQAICGGVRAAKRFFTFVKIASKCH